MERLDLGEFIAGYLAEAEDHLASANVNLLALDQSLKKQEKNPRAVRELFRSLHTLKGLSAMVGAEPIVDISHEMETLLRNADRAGGSVPAEAVDVLLAGVRAIEERVASLSRGETLAAAPKELLEQLSTLDPATAQASAPLRLALEPELAAKLSPAEREQLLSGLARGLRALRIDFVPSPERSEQGVNVTSVRKRVSDLAEIVKVIPRSLPELGAGRIAFVLLVLSAESDAALAEAACSSSDDVRVIAANGAAPSVMPPEEALFEAESSAADTLKRNVVRVEVSRLDEALDRLAVLVVSRARLQLAVDQLAQGQGDLRRVSRLVADGSRELRDLRAAIMRARMVSVAELLERAPLIVRGASKASKKQVQLVIDAGRAELDKSVADRLFPAVVHLLRNAVDHAIEGPEERKNLGKPEEGTIRVTCVEQGGSQLSLVIEDDGRGIDRERVARRAQSPVPETDAELLELITRPGLSTLDAATQTSGRGLGMDIVKRIAVDELGGELSLETRANQGTTFTLHVPVSVSIIDVFSLKCGDETFVVPVSAVDDLAELGEGSVMTTPEPSRRSSQVRLFRHRGKTMPLFRLSRLLGVSAPPVQRPKALIVRKQNEAFAFEVDHMLGKQEVVVRPVKDPLVNVAGISGSTDLGDGRPTLVLDLLGLMARAVGAGSVAP
jgi:two-component system chemotaxis sensor kinase CheA